jgi:hypothetical protein
METELLGGIIDCVLNCSWEIFHPLSVRGNNDLPYVTNIESDQPACPVIPKISTPFSEITSRLYDSIIQCSIKYFDTVIKNNNNKTNTR